ncbi:MAG: hypothetical protein OXT68_09125 [Chloroflexota bacterium]|nr:hypothetical protein [Chloroflexota bacterium]
MPAAYAVFSHSAIINQTAAMSKSARGQVAGQSHQIFFTTEDTEDTESTEIETLVYQNGGDVGAFDGQCLRDPLKRPQIIDHFRGRLTEPPLPYHNITEKMAQNE